MHTISLHRVFQFSESDSYGLTGQLFTERVGSMRCRSCCLKLGIFALQGKSCTLATARTCIVCFVLVFILVLPAFVTLSKAAEVPKVDVVFSFDLTESMSYYFGTAKSQASSIMAALNESSVDAAFGVVSHMDYPHTYQSYGYGATYGVAASGDYAYRLDQPVTQNRMVVSSAIGRLTLGSGSYDDPEDYERVLYESYADPSVGWRPDAARVLVMLCDSIPHDDNLNEGVPGKIGNLSTGGDPGRDEIMFTPDDLDLQTVLGQMATNHVVLLVIRYGYLVAATAPYWQLWASLTGGEMYTPSNANDVSSKIQRVAQTVIPEIGPISLLILAGCFTAAVLALRKRRSLTGCPMDVVRTSS